MATGLWLLADSPSEPSLRAQTRNLLNTEGLPETKSQKPEAEKQENNGKLL